MRGSLLKRFAIVTLVALVAASVASLAISYRYSYNEAIQEGTALAESAAFVVSTYLKRNSPESIRDADPETYQSMHDDLRGICESFHMMYISVYSANDDRTVRTYYYAVGASDKDDKVMMDKFYLGSTSSAPFDEDELNALSGEIPGDKPGKIENEYGNTYAWFYPLRMNGADDYWIICVEFDASRIAASVADNALSFAIPMIAILILLMSQEAYYLHSSILKPLRSISSRMRGFVNDRAPDAELRGMGHGNEVLEIAESFDQMSTDIEHYVSRIEEMTEERVASSTELQVARRIQLGFVPETSEEIGPGFEAYALCRAAREVGGDFYDLFVREDGRVCVVMADVTGKGVSAALFMSMCRTLIHEKLALEMDPARVLNGANTAILRNNPEGLFVTVFAGVYNPSTNELLFANAGHTRPYVIGKGYLNPDPGIALGLFDDADIVNERVELASGEGILLYTDGANEAVSSQDTFYGEERLAQAACDATSAQSAVLSLAESIDSFTTGREQSDDLTILCLFARSENVWHWALPLELSSFATLRQGVLELCGNSVEVRRALLALDEAFSNVVNYSGASKVDVWARSENGVLSIRLVDDGMAFNPLEHVEDEREFEDLCDGGMGISLVKQVTSDLSYERVDDRNILVMCFELEANALES